MIELRSLHKTYPVSAENPVAAVRGVDLTIQDGDFLVITGRSGSGKTTLLNLIAGLARPTAGQVLLDGQDIWKLPDPQQSQLRNQCIGFVFQFPSLLPSLSTLENVLLPLTFRRKGRMNGHGSELNGSIERAAQLLERVGLEDKLDALPRQLSAGQQQRVVIARALLQNPKVLLADEPTSDLDEQTELEIMELFREVHQETGLTIVMVTHTSQLVRFGTRSIEMVAGKVLEKETAA